MSRTILGVNLLHDTSAAIIKDGKIIAAAEEERFNRKKHTLDFPHAAIKFCLDTAGISLESVDQIVSSFDPKRFLLNFDPFEENVIKHDDDSFKGSWRVVSQNLLTFLQLSKKNREFLPRSVMGVPHHLSHAYCAFSFSGMSRANVITIDGRGERESTCIYLGMDDNVKLIDSYRTNDSVGHLYTYATYLCGLYSSIGQEGKTMGLAPYGTVPFDIINCIEFGNNRYKINWKKLRNLNESYSAPAFKFNSRNVALGAQQTLEKIIEFLANRLSQRTKLYDFCLAGGVALNAAANGYILDKGLAEKLFIFPAANDAGTSVGAAAYASKREGCDIIPGQEIVYLGPAYSDMEIKHALADFNIKYEHSENIEKTAASLLAQGYILGWFQGRMEFGPRALGNRSILADPRRNLTKERLDRTIKHREEWRPYAPAILFEQMDAFYTRSYYSPFMTINFSARSDKRHLIPAVVHVDGTSRVQTVTKDSNPTFYGLVSSFAKLTGIPLILNTSFNMQGEPIVCSPEDAIRCFMNTELDALCIGNYLVLKENCQFNNFEISELNY